MIKSRRAFRWCGVLVGLDQWTKVAVVAILEVDVSMWSVMILTSDIPKQGTAILFTPANRDRADSCCGLG